VPCNIYSTYICISLDYFLFIYFLAVIGFEPRALCLADNQSYNLKEAPLQALFATVIFVIGSRIFDQGGVGNAFLPFYLLA
jgi:hypothetical protein